MKLNKIKRIKKLNKKKKDLSTHLSFLTMIPISLFCCYKKVFILMSTRMIGESLMTQHYLKKENFIAT